VLQNRQRPRRAKSPVEAGKIGFRHRVRAWHVRFVVDPPDSPQPWVIDRQGDKAVSNPRSDLQYRSRHERSADCSINRVVIFCPAPIAPDIFRNRCIERIPNISQLKVYQVNFSYLSKVLSKAAHRLSPKQFIRCLRPCFGAYT